MTTKPAVSAVVKTVFAKSDRDQELLRTAILDDGVDYLAPLANRFGENAQVPAVIDDHADRDLDLISAAWADHTRFSYVPTATLTLSCLLELVDSARTRSWFDEKFAAEALVRQGREAEALARAAALLDGDHMPPGYRAIARFCETLLIRQGKVDEAYPPKPTFVRQRSMT